MSLYELKLKITPSEKDKLINQLGLTYVEEYSDIDHFLVTKSGQPKEKIKEIKGKTVYYKIMYNKSSGLFKIDSQDVTEDPTKISDLKTRPKSMSLQRVKEIYSLSRMDINVAFDYLEGVDEVIFLEVYSQDEALVFKFKGMLVELGYRKFISKTYDELFSEQKPIFKEPLAWILLVVIIGLGLFILWYFN